MEKTFSSPNQKSRALRRAALVTLLAGLPVLYFGYVHWYYGQVEIQPLGQVPHFEFINEDSLFSSVDLVRRVSVVANLQGCGACEKELDQLAELKGWISQTLVNPNPRDTRPDDATVVILHTPEVQLLNDQLSTVTTKVYELASSEEFLTPLRSKESDLVAISQDGFFVYRHRFGEDLGALRNILKRVTAETYLLQYLHEQALMWKKSKG